MADRPPLRLVADDLTGALDSAAPFARAEAPVEVLLPGGGTPGPGDAAISSESRAMSGAAALAAVRRCWRDLGATARGHLWFKKVDSVLRGHPFAETAAMLDLGGFRHCVFAPAFPQMGRITRHGLHWVQDAGNGWAPGNVHDLCAGFHAIGIAAERVGNGEGLARVAVADAETEDDLSRLVAKVGRDAPVLWAGSAGLARALAGAAPPLRMAPVAHVVIGTTHPATRRQIGSLGSAQSRIALIDPAPDCTDAAETMRELARHVAGMEAAPHRDRTTMIIGGDTLSAVLAAVGAERLWCLGEAGPGLPVARIGGGRWHGCQIVTKSGGFGDAGLLARLIADGVP